MTAWVRDKKEKPPGGAPRERTTPNSSDIPKRKEPMYAEFLGKRLERAQIPLRSCTPTHRQKRPVGLQHMVPMPAISKRCQGIAS